MTNCLICKKPIKETFIRDCNVLKACSPECAVQLLNGLNGISRLNRSCCLISREVRDYKSKIEEEFSLLFIRNDIPFFYESVILRDSHCTYIPDFYLPSHGVFLELKGNHRQRIKKVKYFTNKELPIYLFIGD